MIVYYNKSRRTDAFCLSMAVILAGSTLVNRLYSDVFSEISYG